MGGVAEEQRGVGQPRIVAVALASLLLLAGFIPAGDSVADTPGDASGIQVCNAYLDGIGPDDPPSAVAGQWGGCFESDVEAKAAAEANARAEGIQASRRVKIGLDCDGSLFRGCALRDHLWWYGNSGGCDGNTRYADRDIGEEWNDRASGARGYNGCNRFIHFEHSGFRGDWISCGNSLKFGEVPPGRYACLVIAAFMTNKTSSEAWHHCRNGETACRGKFP